MGLPPYTGPFKVGVLDLEIPVRKPRSFCSNVVEPGVLNKPAKKARKQAEKANKQAKADRQAKDKEHSTQQAGTSSTGTASSATGTSSRVCAASEDQRCDDDCCQEARDESEGADDPWSPWSTGSKTCTLHLETVLFTIYYPALPMPEDEVKRYPRAAWLGRPVHAGVRALLQYIGQYGIFALPASPAVLALVNARLPARVGPPLADPEELHRNAHPERDGTDRADTGNFGKRPPQFPVVIFSHGLAGNRLSYSQYCGELASKGVIVAAIEHRDGSGVSSIVRGEEAPDKAEQGGWHMPHIIGHRSSGRMKASVPYFTFETIGLQSFATEPSEREVDLRKDQIEMRHAEIEETFWVLNEINAGRGYEIVQRSTRNLGTKLAGHAASTRNSKLPTDSLIKAERPLKDWEGKLDLEFPTLCGHSFGGATVIEMMRRENPYPIAIVLDPWVEPVGDPSKQEDEVKGRLSKPIYVLNSESFTVWEEHFEKLKRICLDARKTSGRGWLLTLTGSKHTDFSDYPFLLPKIFRSTVGPRQTIEVFSTATYKQMGLSRQRQREQEDRPGYKVDRQGSLRNVPERDQSKARTRATLSPLALTGSNEQVVSPTSLEGSAASGTSCLSGLENRGKELTRETVVQSPTCDAEQIGDRHEAVDARVNAKAQAATPGIERSTLAKDLPASPSSAPTKTECSHQELQEECKQDTAQAGPQARDTVRERHQQASLNAIAAGDDSSMLQRDFITDIRYLEMIDADHDVQQVHEELEEVAERLKNKNLECRIDRFQLTLFLLLSLFDTFALPLPTLLLAQSETRPRSLMGESSSINWTLLTRQTEQTSVSVDALKDLDWIAVIYARSVCHDVRMPPLSGLLGYVHCDVGVWLIRWYQWEPGIEMNG
ncbi:acetylhydrolase [Pseudozyma hubeiensis SY62]|uniref:1-alkyl-2-acetylglycerophosphocholine esterase n=1 Tax=Pseudozyma hubeiensis (strain SY62) TaxID=1305764 RepID=R9P5S7_PSEHS|nr:acetylhydrolase [Pseudozyma hubeiensis SY62]GAC96706.1 acetylhydrolase [Pseudozyma hubeiensis SY62]